MVLEISFVVALSIGIAAFFWFMVRQSSRKIVRQYQKMAQQMKISLTEPEAQLCGFIRSEPFVHGMYRRREVSISVPAKGLQNTRQIETIIKVKVKEESFTWQMTSNGLLGGLRQRDCGTKGRWLSGDPLFDSVLNVRTNDEGRFSRIFHVDRRALITDILKGSKGTIALQGGVLSFAEFGMIADDLKREQFEKATDMLCDLAEVIEGR